MEHKGDSDTYGGWGTLNNLQRLVTGSEDMEIKEQVENFQTTALFWYPEYWEESRVHEETCCPSNSCEKPSVYAGVKTPKWHA